MNINLKINDNSGFLKLSRFQSKLFDGDDLIISSSFENDNTNFLIDFNSVNGNNKINFNHTVDKDQRSVFSFSKISFDYNNNKWILDESLDMYAQKAIYSKENNLIELFNNVKIMRNNETAIGDYAKINTIDNSYKITSKDSKRVKLIIEDNE